MKSEFHKSSTKRLFPEHDLFEHFLVSYGIKTLNAFREKLKDVQSFRKIVMSTSSDVTWTKELLEQSLMIGDMNYNGKDKKL